MSIATGMPPVTQAAEAAAWAAWHRQPVQLEEAADRLQAAGDDAGSPELRALGEIFRARAALHRRDDEACRQRLQQALATHDSPRLASLAEDLQALLQIRQGDVRGGWERAARFEQRTAQERPATDHYFNACVLADAGMILGRFDEALEQGYRSCSMAQASGLVQLQAAALHNLATNQLNLLNVDDALPLQEQAREAIEQAGLHEWLPVVWHNLILLHDLVGDQAAAAKVSATWVDRHGPPDAATLRQHGAAIATGRLAAGDAAGALQALAEMPSLQDGDLHRALAWPWARARALLALDQPEQARTACEEGLAALARAPTLVSSPYNRVRLHDALRDACERLGDFRAALAAQKEAQQAAVPVIGRSTRARYVSLKLQGSGGDAAATTPRDQSRLHAVEQSLQQLATGLAAPPVPAAAEDAVARQRRFIAHVSHEIRGALNGVLGMNELLLRTGLDPRQSRYVSMAQSSAQTVLSLLNDVLDMAKLEAGKFELHEDALDIAGLVRELAGIFEPQAQLGGLQLLLDLAEPLPPVLGDRLRIRQVLTNLLSNALKFTRQGQIGIHVACEASGPDRQRVRIEVRDTGRGIAPEALATLFQEFAQTGPAADRAKGSGLGLALSRELARRMGGDLTATSVFGQGSTFRLELSLRMVHPAALAA